MPRTRTISRETIVDAALELVERDGLEALTMRALGKRLGVEGMALYTYFSSKDELLDEVALRVLEDLPAGWDPTVDWRERIRRGISSWAELQARHPRAFPLVYRRSLPTEVVSLLTEELFDALRTAGFGPREAALAYQSIIVLVDAALLGRSSWTDADLRASWHAAAERADSESFPRFKEIAPHAATLDWKQILDSGLDLLLRGLERRLRYAQDQ
jgi:TetR/AcrR family transcriptional regulator, tetracycline repressor protein